MGLWLIFLVFTKNGSIRVWTRLKHDAVQTTTARGTRHTNTAHLVEQHTTVFHRIVITIKLTIEVTWTLIISAKETLLDLSLIMLTLCRGFLQQMKLVIIPRLPLTMLVSSPLAFNLVIFLRANQNLTFIFSVCKSKSWIEENRDIVIGVACGAGLLLILFLWCCCCRRNRWIHYWLGDIHRGKGYHNNRFKNQTLLHQFQWLQR